MHQDHTFIHKQNRLEGSLLEIQLHRQRNNNSRNTKRSYLGISNHFRSFPSWTGVKKNRSVKMKIKMTCNLLNEEAIQKTFQRTRYVTRLVWVHTRNASQFSPVFDRAAPNALHLVSNGLGVGWLRFSLGLSAVQSDVNRPKKITHKNRAPNKKRSKNGSKIKRNQRLQKITHKNPLFNNPQYIV